MRLLTALFFCFSFFISAAQPKQATVSGSIIDENENPVPNVSVIILGKTSGIRSSDSGRFTIKVEAEKALALVFSHTGYITVQKIFFLSPGEKEDVIVRLSKSGKVLDEVILQDERERREAGLTRLNPKNAVLLPSTTGGVEALVKTLVGSNNELTSQYNVRGGSYDENLVYINDYEIYRPYLVSSGQQEGLSMINPELARNVSFYTGGFQAKYGDKMSSVLDIQYKKPKQFGGSVYASLLEQGLHLEGSAKDSRLSYLAGIRNKNNRSVLSNQPTFGAYIPSSSDVQAYITYRLSSKMQVELLGILSSSRFDFYPESVKKTASVFSPLFTANLGLDIFFEGREKDNYQTNLLGLSIIQNLRNSVNLKWMLSRFNDKEKENYDIAGAYVFGERDFDNSSSTFGQIVNPLGAGYYQNYGRNELDIEVYNLSHKGSVSLGKNFLQWGAGIDQTKINDKLLQWEYRDSAGYSLPYNPPNLQLYNALHSSTSLDIQKYHAYLQDNIHFTKGKTDITLQGGVRVNYNSLNKEFLVSPRVQASWKPGWKKDFIFRLAAGIYSQPPFYRELRDYNGNLNLAIRAQKSFQAVGGMDYNFKGPGQRPFRLTTEAYYKSMTDVVPYDIDNVKIKYLGANNARAYAAGVEFRLFGELVKDAESWVSLGFMRTRENLDNDYYYLYKNAAGEIIGPKSDDQVVADSVRNDVEWLRRPSDRLITLGIFLQDYLATNKNLKVHLNMLYGSNMSYNIPSSVRYRNGLIIEPYLRVDMGFSALLLGERSARRSHSPFKHIDNIWASIEVFNLINRANTISYQLVKDFSNATYAIPNRLTPRLINVKLLARF